LALASCGDPEEEAREAVLAELPGAASVRFGRFTLVGGRQACLGVAMRDGAGWYGPERQAVVRKAETHGENRAWSVEAMAEERHDQCVTRLSSPGTVPVDDGQGPALPLRAAADPARGEQVFRKCAACHTVAQDAPHGLGPNLWGIMGAPIAGKADYTYSPALRAKGGGAWTWAPMDAWLTSPRSFAPGTKMTFAGIRTAQDRADLLVFLNRNGDRALPLP
jgi:cytochrome c2